MIASRLGRSILIAVLLLLGTEVAARMSDSPEEPAGSAGNSPAATLPAEAFALHRLLGYANNPGWTSGINRHNDLGFRGDEITSDKGAQTFRIVCLGGSTVYSAAVEDFHQAYPYLLETTLAEAGYTSIEVTNGGVPGYRSLETLIDFQFRVLDIHPDLVIVSLGLSDIAPRLVWPPSAYQSDQAGFVLAPTQARRPLWTYSALLSRGVEVFGGATPWDGDQPIWSPSPDTAYANQFEAQWAAGSYPEGFFEEISAAEMLAANPPIYFERNLRNLVTTARIHGVGIVFVPDIVSADFPADPYSTAPEYQSALAEHWQVMHLIARELAVPLFDFSDPAYFNSADFADGGDFTFAGNQQRAGLVAEALMSTGLLPAGTN